MKKKIKEAWIKRLRSGRYKQGTGVLRDGSNKYCCIGVLCTIINPNIRWNLSNNKDYYTPSGNTDDGLICSNTGLSKDNLKRAGISNEEQDELIRLNDDEGRNFLEIADHIEKNL